MNLFPKLTKRRKINVNSGLPPGTIVFTGSQKVKDVSIHYLEYDEETVKYEKCAPGEFLNVHKPTPKYVQWYDVRGLHDTDLIESLGETFKMHPLIQEDIANTTQRPKYEEFEEGIFISLRALEFDSKAEEVQFEQVSIFFTKDHVLSFQEREEDLLHLLRERVNSKLGRITKLRGDYLAYAILDLIVDHYFEVMDEIQDTLESMEEEVSSNPRPEVRSRILNMKSQLIRARKAIYPLREVIGEFSRSESEHIDKHTLPYIRDGYDHIIQLMEMVETSRELLSGIQDLYVTEISFRMNKVMQFLTIVTTIFVPITFLAGIYGMNFEHIPELQFKNGYFILLAVMGVISLGLVFFFKRKGWF